MSELEQLLQTTVMTLEQELTERQNVQQQALDALSQQVQALQQTQQTHTQTLRRLTSLYNTLQPLLQRLTNIVRG